MNFKFSKHVPNTDNDTTGNILAAAADPKVISFAGGLPDPALFPVKELKASADKAFDNNAEEALQYGNAIGTAELRQQIIDKLLKHRQIDATIDNISITSGSEQSLEMLAKMFINPGDTVIVEKPTYLCTIQVFESYEANIVAVDMDEEGMRMDSLEEALKAHPDTKVIYTIPNFQNPTGRTMSEERRKAFIKLANKYDVPIAEDDPYGAIRYTGQEIPPLKHYDTEGRVIYISTFSKILTPGLRIGWITANPALIKSFVMMKQIADLGTDGFTQFMVANYLKDYNVYDHIKDITSLYKHRSELMLKMIESEFPSNVKHSNPEGGMFFWVEIPGDVDTTALFDECIKNNVAFVPGDAFYAGGKGESGTMRLNFSNVDDETIEVGMKRLGKAVKDFLNK